MATSTTVNRITEILRDANLPWLLPNLRQDFIVWNALNDPSFIEKVNQSMPAKAQDFSPGKLALLALDQPIFAENDPHQPLDSIDDPVVQLAIKTVAERASLGLKVQDLASVGLEALTWLNKFHSTHSWDDLIEALQAKPQRDWLPVIACLFSLLDLPIELLKNLLRPGATPFMAGLAVHAMLSNPFTIDELVEIFMCLCQGPDGRFLSAAERILLIDALSEQCPRAAAECSARWLTLHPESPGMGKTRDRDLAVIANHLLENIFHCKVEGLSKPERPLSSALDKQLVITHDLYCGLISHYLYHRLGDQAGIASSSGSDDVLRQALQTTKLPLPGEINSARQSRLALVLAERGYLNEAKSLIDTHVKMNSDDIEVLFAVAQISFLDGDHPQAILSTSRVLDILNQPSRYTKVIVSGEGLSLTNLGNLLVKLGRPGEAAWVFEKALQICPNEPAILKKFADCCMSAHKNQEASDVLEILVALYPGDIEFRREYAQSLEGLGSWDKSLEQRYEIIRANQELAISHPLTDKYAYAHCAIKASKAELAIEVSQEILDGNPEDCQALVYLGKANILGGGSDKGLQILIQATQIAPGSADAWIELVQAQMEYCPGSTVVQTLKCATQAVPTSPDIHLLLGEYYLQDDDLDQALPELQSSVELSPNYTKALVKYGQALQLLGSINQSREMYCRAYHLEPEYAGLALAYAHLLMGLGALEDAIAPLETLISSRKSHDVSPLMDYARCILTLNNQGSSTNPPMKALIALNEVLQVDPDNAEAKALTAEALTANGEYELAFQAYSEALDTSLIEDKAWFERLSYGFGCVASSIGKQDIAIAALQEASLVNPSNPAIFMALSDAYLSAKLALDAVQAARVVLDIDGEDPDKLAWFANQVARLGGTKNIAGLNSGADTSKNVIDEALSALAKAIDMSPRRTDFLVQLGYFQASIGKSSDAQATFTSIAGLEFATIDDLVSASKYLGDIGDHPSAIACLEQATAIDRNSNIHDPAIYTRLAQEFVDNYDHASAINALDCVIELIPDDGNLISLKVDILLGLGQPLDALDVIEAALHKNLDPLSIIKLFFLESRIERCLGDFISSIKHALQGASLSIKGNLGQGSLQMLNYQLTDLADIYRILLQPDTAFDVLMQTPKNNRSDFGSEQDYLDYLFLHTELALELGERLCPDIQEVKLENSHPSFCRWMAINSRLMNKAGNYKQAEQLFQIAISNLNTIEQSANQTGWSAPLVLHSNLVAVIDAAHDLGLWTLAKDYSDRAIEIAPDEPLSRINYAKTLVLRTEFIQLCDQFDVTEHKPAFDLQPADAYELISQYIDIASEKLEACRELFDGMPQRITDKFINRWHIRAEIIFGRMEKTPIHPEELLTERISPGDTAAVIHYLHQNMNGVGDEDILARIINLARAFPRNPAVILQVALALQAGSPKDALISLQSVLEHNPYTKNPVIAFSHFLLARIAQALNEIDVAQKAVENAISFWPDEDRWHYLAAQIYLRTNNIHEAAQHLQVAAQLDTGNFTYQMELGKLLFENAENDASMLHQALACFENANTLESKDVVVLARLAGTHYLLNNLDQAETYARNALALVPDQASLYQLLCKIAIDKKDFLGAYENANQALQINPNDAESTLMIARALSAMGRYAEALEKLDEVKPSVDDARPLHLERVKIIRKVSGPQIALNELKALLPLYPNDFTVLNALSKELFEVRELDNAMAIAQQALNAHPEKASANEQANLHLLIGQSLRQMGDLDQSIRHLNNAIQLAPNRMEPYLELGLACKERREYQQALRIFEQASVIDPNDPRALFQAGLALKESKDYKSSETMLRKAMSLAPNDLAIRRQLAAVVALNLIHNPRMARANAK